MGKHQRKVWDKLDRRQKSWEEMAKRLATKKGGVAAYRKPGSRKLKKG